MVKNNTIAFLEALQELWEISLILRPLRSIAIDVCTAFQHNTYLMSIMNIVPNMSIMNIVPNMLHTKIKILSKNDNIFKFHVFICNTLLHVLFTWILKVPLYLLYHPHPLLIHHTLDKTIYPFPCRYAHVVVGPDETSDRRAQVYRSIDCVEHFKN